MKVILPVAGRGLRLLPYTLNHPKPLVPVAGKALIDHILESLAGFPVEEVIFITGYQATDLEEHLSRKHVTFAKRFVPQKQFLGLGHAIWLCKPFFQPTDSALILLGDQVMHAHWDQFLPREGVYAVGTFHVDNPSQFGIVEADSDGRITHMVEKPLVSRSHLGIAGVYSLPQIGPLFDAIEYLMENNIRTRNEIQLTDALMHLLQQNYVFRAVPVSEWLDCGSKEHLLHSHTHFFGKGNCLTHPNAIIHPPVHLGENLVIEDCEIGPFVSIGNGSILKQCAVEHSMIDAQAHLESVRIRHSMIGAHAQVFGNGKGTLIQVYLSDYSSVAFP